MDYDYSDLTVATKQWAEQLLNQGWLQQQQAMPLLSTDGKTPDSLFSHASARPLIVAFMGGTGVGKSTLLNRLAGKNVARTGVERPTSREVTLFHHNSVIIQNLPDKLPLEQIRLAQHDDESKKNIIWVDMPDFDSIEQSNQQQVMEWLPHIDVLIYVVSPERYRDNKAWRILLAEGGKHGWVFVLNQWDKGLAEQYEDFNKQLKLADFTDPLIFKTACGVPLPDDFDQLQQTLTSLATENTINQLESIGIKARSEELKEKLTTAQQYLGTEQGFVQLTKDWQQQWQKTESALVEGFKWPIQALAKHYAEQAAHLIEDNRDNRLSERHSDQNVLNLWDNWAQNRLEDVLGDVVLAANQLGIPDKPLKSSFAEVHKKAGRIIHEQTELAARKALANPGNAIQRGLLKLARFAEVILPLLAMGWVGFQVFQGYYVSNQTDRAYLGVDFAIHSVLLIALTWLLPYFIRKKLQPSIEKAALSGLYKGVQQGLNILMLNVNDAIKTTRQQQGKHLTQLTEIISRCDQLATTAPISQTGTLSRILTRQSRA